MNAAHIHIIVTHIPLVGLVISFLLLGFEYWRPNPDIRRIALLGFAVSGGFAMIANFTGEGAEDIVEQLPGVMEAAIDRHEDAAGFALTSTIIAGVAALLLLIPALAASRLARPLLVVLLIAGVVGLGAVGYTANLGGKIRHTEIAGAQAAAGESGALSGDFGTRRGEDHDKDDDD